MQTRHHAPLVALTIIAAMAGTPGLAYGQPPPNDNYLSSTVIQDAEGTGMQARHFSDVQDTSAATTQADLFNPDRSGAPFSGGGPEPTLCDGQPYGSTVWYDMHPRVSEVVELQTAGFATAIAVYQWDTGTLRIIRSVGCRASTRQPNDYVVPEELEKGRAYTVQIGGLSTAAGFASGRLDFSAIFYPDHDGDNVYDVLDACPQLAGVLRFDGCPPAIRLNLSLGAAVTSAGLRLSKVTVYDIPGGTRVEVRCSCGIAQVRSSASHASSVAMTAFVGHTLPFGSNLEVWATKRATGAGNYRFGAIGGYVKYALSASGRSSTTRRCLMPGSRIPRRACPPGGRHQIPR